MAYSLGKINSFHWRSELQETFPISRAHIRVKTTTFLEDLDTLCLLEEKKRDSSGLFISIMTAQESSLYKTPQREWNLNVDKEVVEVPGSYNVIGKG